MKRKTKSAKKQIKRRKPIIKKQIKKTIIEEPEDLSNPCRRCKYPIGKDAITNLCDTCKQELFMLGVHNLNEYI